MPIGVGLVPHAVEPNTADGAVVGEEFGELAVHVGVEIGVPVAVIRAAVRPVRGAARVVVRIVPVELGVIEEQLDSLAVALVGQHFQGILLVGRARDDVPVGDFGVEHRKAVMMAGGDGDVLHARGFGQRDPGAGVEFLRIEEQRQAIVFLYRELAIVEYPLAVAENAVDAPMNEHSEFHVLKFATGLEVFGTGLVVRLAQRGESEENARAEKNDANGFRHDGSQGLSHSCSRIRNNPRCFAAGLTSTRRGTPAVTTAFERRSYTPVRKYTYPLGTSISLVNQEARLLHGRKFSLSFWRRPPWARRRMVFFADQPAIESCSIGARATVEILFERNRSHRSGCGVHCEG